LLALVSACSGGGAERRVVFDLTADWTSAEVVRGDTGVRFGDPQDRHLLVHGWGDIERSGEQGRPVAWAVAPSAEVETVVFDPTVAALHLRCRPFNYPGAPAQTVRVELNGSDLGSLDLESAWTTYSLVVPPGVVRRGRNRVRFDFAHVASPADVVVGASDRRTLAVSFDSLELGGAEAVARSEPPVVVETGALRVAAGHALVYRLAVPAGGALELGPATEATGGAAAEVWTRAEGGDEVARHPVTARGRLRASTIELSEDAGSIVDLWLVSLPARGGEATSGHVVWDRPELWTSQAGPEANSNVVLVVVDTLRADFLGCYGGDVTTPAMDALAAGGVRFETMYSHIPITGPSHASLFTSLLPMEHGVHNNAQLLAVRHVTMAELLRSWYRSTAGFVSLGVLQSEYGFAQGFDSFEEQFGLEWHRPAAEMTDLVERWSAEQARRPFFLFVHYSDPHEPYAPPTLSYPGVVATVGGVEVGRFEADGRAVSLRLEVEAGTTRVQLDAAAPPLERRLGFFSVRLRESGACTVAPGPGWWVPGRRGPSKMSTGLPAELEITNPQGHAQVVDLRFYCKEILSAAEVRERYGLEVEYVDREIGRLLRGLTSRGLLDDTLVVLTSDHGEGVGDHRLLGHIDQLYDSLIRVPLIISFPGRLPAGVVIEDPVSVIDVLPTVLDVLGLPPRQEHRGQSLLPLIRGSAVGGAPVLAETYRPEAPEDLRAVVDRGHKLIVAQGAAARVELYDLASDPGELHDMAGDRPELVQQLRATLNRLVAGADRSAPTEASLGDEERAQLEALGYVHE
jgi:hypothetical protein